MASHTRYRLIPRIPLRTGILKIETETTPGTNASRKEKGSAQKLNKTKSNFPLSWASTLLIEKNPEHHESVQRRKR